MSLPETISLGRLICLKSNLDVGSTCWSKIRSCYLTRSWIRYLAAFQEGNVDRVFGLGPRVLHTLTLIPPSSPGTCPQVLGAHSAPRTPGQCNNCCSTNALIAQSFFLSFHAECPAISSLLSLPCFFTFPASLPIERKSMKCFSTLRIDNITVMFLLSQSTSLHPRFSFTFASFGRVAQLFDNLPLYAGRTSV